MKFFFINFEYRKTTFAFFLFRFYDSILKFCKKFDEIYKTKHNLCKNIFEYD